GEGTPRAAYLIRFTDAQTGYIDLKGGILKTEDGGQHWFSLDKTWSNVVSSPQLLTMTFLGSGTGLISTPDYNKLLVYGAAAPAAAPVSLQAVSEDRKVELSWAKPQGFGISGYRIERSTQAAGPYAQLATVNGTVYQDTNVINGTVYYYRISAVSPLGTGPAASVSATPSLNLATVPDAISQFFLYPQNGKVTLRWERPAEDGGTAVTGYVVQRATAYDGPYTTLSEPGLPTLNYTGDGEYIDNTCVAGTVYWYRVAAKNSRGVGSYSTPLGVRTGQPWIEHIFGPVGGLNYQINHVRKVAGTNILYASAVEQTSRQFYLLKSIDGGENWTVVSQPPTVTYGPKIYPLNEQTLIMPGRITFGGTISDPTLAMYKSTDGGVTFTRKPIDTGAGATSGADFINVDFYGNKGVAVGAGGYIARTTDGGETWTLVRKPAVGAADDTHLIRAVWAGPDTIYVIGYEGIILKSTDSGVTWTNVAPGGLPVYPGDGRTIQFNDIAAIDANNIWVVGDRGTILHTVDGGNSWQNTAFPQEPLAGSGEGTPRAAYLIRFTDAQT
ncbi:hypothetical protein FDZ73_21475, partial [bacterium]